MDQSKVLEIRRLASTGYRVRDIALEVGVHPRTVYKWAEGYYEKTIRRQADRVVASPSAIEAEERIAKRYKELVESGSKRPMVQMAGEEGVTRERISQRIAQYEKRTGILLPRPPRINNIRNLPRVRTIEDRIIERCVWEDGHWAWKGTLAFDKYPVLYSVNGHTVHVRKKAYEVWVGDVLRGYVALPTCGRNDCVNPEHIKVITVTEHYKMNEKWDSEKGFWRRRFGGVA